ncbi:LLM class flavin-dependent oxidoreductase, partial [Mycobacterium kansasii]
AWTDLLQGKTVDMNGRYVRIEGGQLHYLPLQEPHPPLMCGASSGAGQAFAAKWIDTVLTWGEPPEQVQPKLDEMRAKAHA